VVDVPRQKTEGKGHLIPHRTSPDSAAEARVKAVTILLLAAIVAGCGPAGEPPARPDDSGLKLALSMPARDFRIGGELPAPRLAIINTAEEPIELIGPTLTVVTGSLIEPDGTVVDLRLAMPTGRDPSAMPKRRLAPGMSIDFTPEGIWHYVDGAGYEPYVFAIEGTHRFWCRYETVASDTLTLTVRG
jgi:hypothetical protein